MYWTPELRDPINANDVARRLTLQAVGRLRRMDYTGAMSFFRPRLKKGVYT
jgi:hypothetical protein